MLKVIPGLALCATASVLLAACDDGSNDGGVGVPPSSSLISYVGSPDVLAAWADPSTLSFNGPTVGSYAGKRQLMRGNVDPMTGADLGQQAGVEMWKGSDGHVWAVDLTVADTGTPAAVQVSSEAGATVDDTCTFTGTQAPGANLDYQGVLFAADLATPTASAYIYRLPGADGVCDTADDVVHLVHPNMGSSDTPVTGTAMPAAAIYSSAGAITGYVAKSGANLVMLDTNLANPAVVGSFGANVQVADPMPIGLETGYPTGRLFDVDGNLVYVDYAAGTTSASLFSIPNWTATDDQLVTAASPTTLYFAVNTPSTGTSPATSTIYSMPADGSAVPTIVSVQPGLVRQMEFPVQGTDLVVGVADAGDFAIVAIPEGQSDGSLGTTIALGTGDDGGRFTATADDVYYTMWSASTASGTTTRSNVAAGIAGMDATVVQAPVAGAQFLVGGEVDPWTAGDTQTQRMPFTTVFQASGMTTTMTSTDPTTGNQYAAPGLAGATLVSIDTGSNTAIATLGTFPATTSATLMEGTFRGIGHAFFIDATTQASTQDPSTHDLYLLNSRTSGSLEAATSNLGQ